VCDSWRLSTHARFSHQLECRFNPWEIGHTLLPPIHLSTDLTVFERPMYWNEACPTSLFHRDYFLCDRNPSLHGFSHFPPFLPCKAQQMAPSWLNREPIPFGPENTVAHQGILAYTDSFLGSICNFPLRFQVNKIPKKTQPEVCQSFLSLVLCRT